MICEKCIAANDDNRARLCKAGVWPYPLANGKPGCCFNAAQIKKALSEKKGGTPDAN